MALEAMFKVGMDLGMLADFSALVVMEATRIPGQPVQRSYMVRHIERWRGTEYTEVATEVAEILAPLTGRYQLTIDASGVGVSAVEHFKAVGLSYTAVTITGGDTVGRNLLGPTVPKADLVHALEVVLQQHRLRVADELEEEGRVLARELEMFARRQNPVTGKNQFAVWESGEHDDEVLATAVSVWDTERRLASFRGALAVMEAQARGELRGGLLGDRGGHHPELTHPIPGGGLLWPQGAFSTTIDGRPQ